MNIESSNHKNKTNIFANISAIFQAVGGFLSKHTGVPKILNILWPLALFLWVAYINRFPQGYVYVSGDFAQPINIENIFKNLFYTWGNGIAAPAEGGFFSWFAAIPYYSIFYLLPHKLGFSESTTLSYVLFLFLSFAYFSFLAALKLVFDKRITFFTRTFALIYPINLTTLYFFTYTWGFSHQVFLYITLPLLGVVFYRYIFSPSIKKLLAFLLLLFISISGFTNAAFFAALCFFLLLFLISQVLLKNITLNKKFLLSLFILGVSSFFVIIGWIGPSYLALQGQFSSLTDGMFNLNTWLSTQSADVLSILIGLPGYKGFFPFSHNVWSLYFFAFLPILAALFLLVSTRSDPLNSRKRLSLSLILISVIFMLLIKKGQEPFGGVTLMLFSAIPFLSLFRSYEKLALFMPFLTLAGLYGLVPERWKVSKCAILMSIITLFAAAPFLTGGIQTKYSITLGDDPTKDYTTSKYSGLVKIPSDYYKIAEIVNKDFQDSKIQDLPYSVLNSAAWVNYLKWKLIGFNVTQNLLSKPTIGQNASQFNLSGWYPTLELNRLQLKPGWYIKMLSFFNVSHVVYHKGVDDRFIFESLPRINELEKENYIQRLYNGQFALLYKINEQYRLPHFYIPKRTFYTDNDLSVFPYLLTVLDTNVPANYLFRGAGQSSLDMTEAKAVAVIGETVSLNSLMDNHWGQTWLWPPLSDPKNLVDLKLIDVINTAAKMKAWDSYDNVLLQVDFSSAMNGLKSAVEAELDAHPTGVDRNKLLERVLKYLLMVNANFGNSDKTNDYFMPVVNSFDSWAMSKENVGCLYGCYRVDIPETGEYEILIENPENSISQAKLYLRDSNIVKNTFNSEDAFINFGSSVFTKNQPAKLDLDLTYNSSSFLDNSGWKNDSIQGERGISRKIVGLEPNQKCHLSLKYKGSLDKLFFVVIEDSLDFDNTHISTPVDSFISYPQKESLIQYASIDVKDGVDRQFFSSDRAVGTGKIFIFDMSGKDVDPKDIADISIERAVSPKIILRKVTDSQASVGQTPEIKIKNVNPTKYRVLVSKATDPYSLVFSESFHKQWKVYLSPYSYELAEKKWESSDYSFVNSITEIFNRKEIAKDAHYLANGYSNFWVIRPEDVGKADSYELIVEYQPQLLFYLGTASSLLVLVGLILVVCLRYIKQRRRTNV